MCTKILSQYFYIAHYILKHYGNWLTNLITKATLNRSSYFKLQNSPRHKLETETSKMDPIKRCPCFTTFMLSLYFDYNMYYTGSLLGNLNESEVLPQMVV